MNDDTSQMHRKKTRSNGYAKIDQYNPAVGRAHCGEVSRDAEELGEDPDREGLVKTPERVAKALQFLTHGYDLDPAEILRSAMFREEYQQMVIVRDIEVYSLCEHHMLPFFGKAHVAYIPNGHIVGLSKIPRVVDAFARRLQVQERLTVDIRNCIEEHAAAARRGGGDRGAAHVHGHARHPEAAFDRDHFRFHRRIQHRKDARRVHAAHHDAVPGCKPSSSP